MDELIHEHQALVFGPDQEAYRPLTMGEQRADGTWAGWIEFHPVGGGSVLVTGQETSQPNRDALLYWATGIEPIYFEGALERAT